VHEDFYTAPSFIGGQVSRLLTWIEGVENAASEAVIDVVKSCPSYFPPHDPNYWSNNGNTQTFFQPAGANNTTIVNAIAAAFSPLTISK